MGERVLAVVGGGAGVNVVYHAAGWLEGGLCASYEKFVMDCETLQQIIAYLKPVPVTEEDVAVEAIREVGSTGHFFGCRHTQDRYETAFYGPFLSDWSNFESWEERGAIRHPAAGQRHLEEDPRRVRGAADGRGDPRGARSVRGTAQARGRGADGFLRPRVAGRGAGLGELSPKMFRR